MQSSSSSWKSEDGVPDETGRDFWPDERSAPALSRGTRQIKGKALAVLLPAAFEHAQQLWDFQKTIL